MNRTEPTEAQLRDMQALSQDITAGRASDRQVLLVTLNALLAGYRIGQATTAGSENGAA